jgi:hypothetical protein
MERMSAFMVSRKHIIALVTFAASVEPTRRCGGMSWYHDGSRHEVRRGVDSGLVCAAQMLWDENLRSINARYPDTVDHPNNIPGPVGETYRITTADFKGRVPSLSPVAILKACDCYEYQACEHDGWTTSEANAFLGCLRKKCVRNLPGYDDASWNL